VTSSSSAAELDPAPHSSSIAPPPDWKREANHRLAAHRARRGGRGGLQSALPGMEDDSRSPESAPQAKTRSVADRVAARYAKAPTYSEMLAAEARNAARAAEAAAVAAGEARDAAQAILAGLDVDLNEGLELSGAGEEIRRSSAASPKSQDRSDQEDRNPTRRPLAVLDAESEEPFDDEPAAPVQPLPAKLLEFPRELVAARRARPRLAEGPLREEYGREGGPSQLRIFEVEAEAISTEPALDPVLPGWSAIRLGSSPDAYAAAPEHCEARGAQRDPQGRDTRETAHNSVAAFDLPLQTASLEDRLMAGIVDAALTFGGFLIFVFVFAACTAHPPMGKPALVGAGVALCAFAAIYQTLFFCFGHDTPGMRYAKIALCTFDDENPTRRAMRRRLGALLLSVSPLGLGVLWAFFDDDRLGWHDRISRTYQRSYR
jgi:uncharacterized RDD family membrane protein YckC